MINIFFVLHCQLKHYAGHIYYIFILYTICIIEVKKKPPNSRLKSRECGGYYSKKVVHVKSGTVIPIPYHGDTIQECYIVELKRLLDDILEGE